MQERTAAKPGRQSPTLSPHPAHGHDLHAGQLNVRVLDPLTAYQVKDQTPVQPAAFVADSLLVQLRTNPNSA